jgi:hypothetical protein
MKLVLKQDMFVNGKYSVSYGTNREALFTIVDEEFPGDGHLGRINRITVLVREFDGQGNAAGASLQGSIIGMGNGIVGVKTDVPELRGQVLSKDNMEACTVILYE